MQTKFKVIYKNRELGPLVEAQILKMISAKQLLATDKYFDEEKKDWVEISHRFLGPKPSAPPKVESAAPAAAPAQSAPPVAAVAAKPSAPPAQQPAEPEFEVIEIGDSSFPAATAKEAVVHEAAAQATSANEKIQFSDGIGTFSLKQLRAGQVSLKLKSQSGLDLPSEISLTIQSAPASQVKLECSRESQAGEKFSLELKAYDAFENFAMDFDGSFEVVLQGASKETRQAQFEKGMATVSFSPTVAESLSLHVRETSQFGLAVPSPCEIKISPSAPVRLVAEAPQQVRAGEDIQVKVIALDAYGNVVNHFKGEIDLQVEAEPLKKIS